MTEVLDQIDEARPLRFRRYPTYRNSGVEWLEKIPKDWEVKQLKHVTTFSTGWTPPTGREDLYGGEHLWANISDLGPKVLKTTEKTISDVAIQEAWLRMVEAGSLLFSFKLSIGAVSIAGVNMYTNEAIAAFTPSSLMYTGYLFWAAPVLIKHNAQTNIYGAALLNRERIANAKLLLPSPSEQRAIAAFLDRETAKIDGLVERKERLIELLQEKRTALITRAVTRGLDPNVPMKDSGVEWLGEIPAHWEVMPLKRLLSRCDYGISENLGGSGDIRVLTMAHIQQGEVELPDDGSISSVDRTMVLEFGDLLFNRTNSRELVGKVGMFRGNQGDHVTFASYLVRLTAREGVEPEWLNYLLNSSGVLGMARSMALLSVNQANLNPTKYQQIVVPTPVLSEQQTIAGYLRCETARIDALIAKVRQAIDHLKEFRTALISAAVTGKIDVREEAS